MKAGLLYCALVPVALVAQEAQPAGQPAEAAPAAVVSPTYTVDTGTRIALGLINSASTKHSAAGDRIYLETVFPIVVNSRIVIPPGSYVTGTVTQVKRPGRVKGRGELYVRFDSITLPNGVTREFRSRLGSIDATGSEHLDKAEGTIKGDSSKGNDAKTIGAGAATGASVGAIVGAARGGGALGSVLGGSAAGAAAGLAAVLLTRGPEAELAKGTTVEMVLDRPLTFDAKEVDFPPAAGSMRFSGAGPVQADKSTQGNTRRFPF